jgi:hypothetical protein
MKFLKQKITILALVLMSLTTFTSCEDNESGVEIIDLEARFITEMVDSRTVSFINTSNDATSYVWNFGNGTTSTVTNPTLRFVNGTYTVSLTATNETGASSTFEETIIIDGCVDETDENIDPANGDLNWTFLNADGNASFDAFGNIGGGIVGNPVLDDVNRSCFVFKYDKVAGCEVWSGAGYVLNTSLDFSTMTSKIFKVKVLAETQLTDVTLLLEFQPFPNNNPFVQRTASITQLGQWQELTFDFSDVNSGTFQNMVIYFERNAPCDGDVYYFDDIIQE